MCNVNEHIKNVYFYIFDIIATVKTCSLYDFVTDFSGRIVTMVYCELL
jgi:hypothetical protein